MSCSVQKLLQTDFNPAGKFNIVYSSYENLEHLWNPNRTIYYMLLFQRCFISLAGTYIFLNMGIDSPAGNFCPCSHIKNVQLGNISTLMSAMKELWIWSGWRNWNTYYPNYMALYPYSGKMPSTKMFRKHF